MGLNPEELERDRLLAENTRLLNLCNLLKNKLLVKGMTTKELLDLMKDYPNVKTISVVPGKDRTLHIEFFGKSARPMYAGPEGPTPIPPFVPDMPPDDVMLFAATEDPEDAMKARKD